MGQEEREAIAVSIVSVSLDIKELGNRFSIKSLAGLVYDCGGKLASIKVGGRLYKIPIEGDCVIVLSKRRYLSLELGKEREGSIDTSPHIETEILNLHGKATLQKLVQFKHMLESTDISTALQMYKEHFRHKIEKQKQLIRQEHLLRDTLREIEESEFARQQERRFEETEKLLNQVTEEDLSFYEKSGVKFKHLTNSSRIAVKKWTQELHRHRKTAKDRDAYTSQLKELHSEVSKYHKKKCKGVPSPTTCVGSCDIWKLLHLILYLMEENKRI